MDVPPARAAIALLLALFTVACGKTEESRGEPSIPPRADQQAEAERTGFPARVRNPWGMWFALIPAGEFTMGSDETDWGHEEQEPAHEVGVVRAFYLQTTEVTNAQWRAWRPDHDPEAAGDLPVVNVSHADAVAYAAWLTERDPRFVVRLPTEAEWEYACRASTRTAFAYGDHVTRGDAEIMGGEAELPGEPLAGTGPLRIASHTPNAWGLYDLHGNVKEWCHDRYGPYPLWRQNNPQGAAQGEERVVRGGSYRETEVRARSAARAHLPPDARVPHVGFRLAFGLGYGRTEWGAHEVTIRVVDPTTEGGEASDCEGWPLLMISVIDRLTDRRNELDPRWTRLEGTAPVTLRLAPGRYYAYTWKMRDARRVRGEEIKFQVPGTTVVRVPLPRPYQEHPQ